jgi:hypothetical protein
VSFEKFWPLDDRWGLSSHAFTSSPSRRDTCHERWGAISGATRGEVSVARNSKDANLGLLQRHPWRRWPQGQLRPLPRRKM